MQTIQWHIIVHLKIIIVQQKTTGNRILLPVALQIILIELNIYSIHEELYESSHWKNILHITIC